jgi:hypothetical protein
LPAPSNDEKKGGYGIRNLIGSRKGKLYLKFIAAAVIILAAIYSLAVFATNPSAAPRIVTDANGSTENLTEAFATNQLFGYANFTNINSTQEENSTFKWYKRTLCQPQKPLLVMPL